MSHTVKIDVKMCDWNVAASAAKAIGGKVLGEGSYRFYSSNAFGFGIQLPGWRLPVVIDSVGNASFDNYNGAWGNQVELDKLTAAYALAAAEKVCQDQGWYCERQDGNLLIYHPEGQISVEASGVIDATGFSGGSCMKATAEVEKALGIEAARSLKPEFGETELKQELG